MKRTRNEEVCSSKLPEGLRQRRQRCSGATLNEYVDAGGIDSAIEELKRYSEAPDTEVAAAKRNEAKYLFTYASQYRTLTQLCSLRSISGRNPKIAHGSVHVLGRSFTYHSRQGAGRRYTTIEQRTMKGGQRMRQYGDERDGGKWRSYSQQGCPKALRARFVGRFCRDIDIK